MNTKTITVLKNALRVLSDNREVMDKDGYHALAADMAQSMREIENILVNTTDERVPPYKDRPSVVRGTDDKLYLVFEGSWDVEIFLRNLGIPENELRKIPLHHCSGYENSIEIDLNTYQEPYNDSLVNSQTAVETADLYLRALGVWMLENDHDMNLPDGILNDIDPDSLADRLRRLTR